MDQVGIRELKQNASAVVATVAAGHPVTITDRGRPAAVLSPIPRTRLAALLASGAARAPRRAGGIAALPPAAAVDGDDGAVSRELAAFRAAERY